MQAQVIDYIKNLKLSEVKALVEALEAELGVKAGVAGPAGPAVVVASVYRAWPTQDPPLAMVRPEGDVRDWQITAVEGKLWDRTSPESRSSRKPSHPVASHPAEAKRSPDA